MSKYVDLNLCFKLLNNNINLVSNYSTQQINYN